MVVGRDEQVGVVLSWWDLARVQQVLTDHGFDVRGSRSLLPARWSELATGYSENRPVDGSGS